MLLLYILNDNIGPSIFLIKPCFSASFLGMEAVEKPE